MILCENGGFVANTTTGSIEGRYMQDASGTWFATNGDDGQLAFDFTYGADGSLDAPQLGDDRVGAEDDRPDRARSRRRPVHRPRDPLVVDRQ